MRRHALVAILFRARLGFEVFVAAKNGLFALAEMAESDAKDKGELEMRELSVKLLELFIG